MGISVRRRRTSDDPVIRSAQDSAASGGLRRVVQPEAPVLDGSVGHEVHPEVVEAGQDRVRGSTRVAAEPADQGRVLVVAIPNGQIVVLRKLSSLKLC